MTRFAGLEPQHLWRYFAEFTSIPRPSKKEERILEFIRNTARAKGVECAHDAIGNLLLRVPASPGHEKAPIVVLQNHVDIVAEKNSDTVFDFDNDSIPVWVDGDWIRTKGTTLGADNGLGCAMALALLDEKDAVHGPLELLFTVDEEAGLTGATRLDGAMVKGRIMLNLDTEDEGVFCVGCAGGITCNMSRDLAQEATPTETVNVQFAIRGLQGGHSGMNIIENRGNAIRLLARALWNVSKEFPLRLVRLEGGSKHNAIPREAFAEAFVPQADLDQIRVVFNKNVAAIASEFAGAEPELTGTFTTATAAPQAASPADSRHLLAFLTTMPNGVASMSRDLPGLVETSSNLAIVKTNAQALEIIVSIRSSVMEARDGLVTEVETLSHLSGWKFKASEGYSAWRPNMKSELLTKAVTAWKKRTGQEPGVTAVHAGLECGVIMDKCPGMESISFGPDIRGAHSPAECCSIPSTARVYDFLKELLAALA